MTDIVERLRRGIYSHPEDAAKDRKEAADEIERLQSERNLWEERTKQGAEIIEENVDKIERLRRERDELCKTLAQIDREQFDRWCSTRRPAVTNEVDDGI